MKCTCGTQGQGICSSWCDSWTNTSDQNTRVYDVSGDCFIHGVTNFTAENHFDCIEHLVKEGHCTWGSTKLVVHPAIFYRMGKNNILDFYSGVYTMTGIIVEQSQDCKKTGNVFSSHIVDKETGNVVGELITREA